MATQAGFQQFFNTKVLMPTTRQASRLQQQQVLRLEMAEHQISELTETQIKNALEFWSVQIPSIRSLQKKRLQEVIKTNLMLEGDILTTNEIQVLILEELQEQIIPEWITEFRKSNLSEDEIRTIINKIGRESNSIINLTHCELNSLPLPLGSLRKIKNVLNELGIDIAPPVPARFDSVPSETVPHDSTLVESLAQFANALKRDPEVPEFKKGEDMLSWVNKTKARLNHENVDDATKLRCFKKALSNELLHLSNQIPVQVNDYHLYLDALYEKLNSPSMKYAADYELMNYRYK